MWLLVLEASLMLRYRSSDVVVTNLSPHTSIGCKSCSLSQAESTGPTYIHCDL